MLLGGPVMHALRQWFRVAAAAGLVSLLGCGNSTFRISGATGAAGVTVILTGTATWLTTADATGNYAFGSLENGSYTLTPSKAGYTFNPPSIAVAVNGGDVTGQNFVSTFCSACLWTSVPSGTTNSLFGVWGSGPNDVWAVG